LEQLALEATLFNKVEGASAPGDCDFDIVGTSVQSAALGAEGQLIPLRSESVTSTSVPLLRLTWVHESELKSNRAHHLQFPVYLNPLRLDVLCTADLPCDSTVPAQEWYHQGACITTWKVESLA
jgi:hypothetical protein